MKTVESSRVSSASENGNRRRIELPVGAIRLQGAVEKAPKSRGWVIVASSVGRLCDEPLERQIINDLHDAGFSTLEVDLLRGSEAGNQLIKFDIPRLAKRLIGSARWFRYSQHLGPAPFSFLATGNAAGAALWASSQQRVHVGSVVSLCGRPHLAEPFLGGVKCPTLLLIHADDPRLLHMNRQAKRRLNCANKLVSVAPAKNERQRKDRFRALSKEAVAWIAGAQATAAPPRSRWATLVKNGLGARLKQLSAALAVFSVFVALPSTAPADDSPKPHHKPRQKADREPLSKASERGLPASLPKAQR